MDVIEHLKNPIAALENIRTLLQNNGMLYIHTPNVCTIYRFLNYFINRKKLINYYDSQNLGDLHFQTYDYLTLEKTLNFVGLKVYEIIPTKIHLPQERRSKFLRYFSKFLSKQFPFFSDTLLLKCKKERPINIDEQISFWDKTYNKG